MTTRRRRLYVVPALPRWDLATCARPECHEPMHVLGDGATSHPLCDPYVPPLVSPETAAARALISAAIDRTPKEAS